MKKSFLFILTLAIVSIGVSYAADCDVAAPSCAPAPTCGCAKCGNVFSGLFDCNNHCAQQPACSNCGSPANSCCCNKIGCDPCARPCLAPLFQPRCSYDKPACKSDWYPGKNLCVLNCLFGSLCCDPCAPKCAPAAPACGCGAPACNSCNPCAPKCAPICKPCAPKCAPAAPACGCSVGNRCGQLSCGFCGAKAACDPAACAPAPAAEPTPADPNAAPEAPAPEAPVAACAPTCSPCAPAICDPCAPKCAPATCAPKCAPATCAPSCNPCAPIARCEVDCGLIENWYPGKNIVNFFRVLTAAHCLEMSCGCGAPTCNACNPCAPKCDPCAPKCAPTCAPKCAPTCAPVASCEPRNPCCEFRPFGGLFADLFACFDPCAPKCAPACNPCAPKCAPTCNPCAPKCAPTCNPCVPADPACSPAATVACQPAPAVAPTPAQEVLPEPVNTASENSILAPSEMATAALETVRE